MNTMRWMTGGLLLAAAIGPEATAQEPAKRAVPAARMRLAGAPPARTQEQLIARRDEKLGEAWIKNANWITDYDAVRAKAKETDQPIFAYFTRSYAP